MDDAFPEDRLILPLAALLMFFMLIPIRTDRNLRAVPYVTYALLFLNIFIHLATLHYSDLEFNQFNEHWGLTLTHPTVHGLFTHAFLHGDWSHLLSNMLILWIVGTVLEASIGNVLFLLLYFASMLAAVLLDGVFGRIFQPASLSATLIGASGAVSGVMGFAAFRHYHVRVLTFVALPNIFGSPIWLPIFPIPYPFWMPFWVYAVYFGGKELIIGTAKLHDGVAHWAHLGGMGLGLLAALLLNSLQEGQRDSALEESAKAAAGNAPQQRSLEELQRQLRQNPDDPELLEAMAGLAMMNGEAQGGRTLYMKAIPLFLRLNHTDHAAICYLNVQRAFPDTVLPLRDQMTIASTLETMGHYHEAAQAFVRLAEEYGQQDEAQTALLRAAQIHIKNLQAAPMAARLLTQLVDQYPASPWHHLASERLREVQRQIYGA